MNAIAPYFDGAFAKVFGNATPVSGADNFNMARAQSLLTGELIGGVCPPLTPQQAADVLRWHRPFPASPSTAPTPSPSVGGLAYEHEQEPQEPIRRYADRRGF